MCVGMARFMGSFNSDQNHIKIGPTCSLFASVAKLNASNVTLRYGNQILQTSCGLFLLFSTE